MNGNHRIRNGVMAAMLLGVGLCFLPGGFDWIRMTLRRVATGSVDWASASVATPLWLLALLALIVLSAVYAAASILNRGREKRGAETELVKSGEIFGLRWRWNYRDGEICDLASFCPKCDQPVLPKAETRHGFLRLIAYQCACRQWRSQSFQCSETVFTDRVCRAIRQKAWKKPVRALQRT